jgi:hypothetical protein
LIDEVDRRHQRTELRLQCEEVKRQNCKYNELIATDKGISQSRRKPKKAKRFKKRFGALVHGAYS